MSDADLKSVDHFVIKHEHGSIAWDEPVDLSGPDVDLGKWVQFSVENGKAACAVHYLNPVPLNTRLNKPAHVTLNGFANTANKKNFAEKLQKAFEKSGVSRFNKYDEQTGQVKFYVNHFSAYGGDNIRY
jgi:hypothetical protein